MHNPNHSAFLKQLMKNRLFPVCLALLLVADAGGAEPTPAGPAKPVVRQWTSTGGKALTAEYLGVQGVNVVLKLPDGKITPIPLFKLSEADNTFVSANSFTYQEPWQAWPAESHLAIPTVEVKESPGERGFFVYTTAHFRFRSDVNLGTTLMKDLARVFELTYQLHTKSPFGILAKPENNLFEARLFGNKNDYYTSGAPPRTAGVYILKDRQFLAPLDMMGVVPGSAGWRKASGAAYDPSTIVHELTHMLTHDMLNNLPTWMNEGYAEYIEYIPLEGWSFKVSKDKIKQGMLDSFVSKYEKRISSGRKEVVKLKGTERKDFLKSNKIPKLFSVSKVLALTDKDWVAAGSSGLTPPGELSNMQRLYLTAHAIFYYYIQIEGEKGVAKIRRCIELNRRQVARYNEYLDDFKEYQQQIEEFCKLPGVTKLPDGRIQYPTNLTLPTAPKPPFTDPNTLKQSGLAALLDGESAEVVGQRIEDALRDDLKINLRFADYVAPRIDRGYFPPPF